MVEGTWESWKVPKMLQYLRITSYYCIFDALMVTLLPMTEMTAKSLLMQYESGDKFRFQAKGMDFIPWGRVYATFTFVNVCAWPLVVAATSLVAGEVRSRINSSSFLHDHMT